MFEPLIKVRNVTKGYCRGTERHPVLKNISLNVDADDCIAFVGQNGSGKSTLLRIILGVEIADVGEARISGSLHKRAIGYVPQDYRNALFPWLDLRTNLALVDGVTDSGGCFWRTLSRELIDTYNTLSNVFHVSLDLNKYPYQLSGGEQQIFLLIRAMIQKPKLLVLDEPLSAVDFGRRRFVHDFLGKWAYQTRCTLLFATHDFEEAVLLANRVIVFCGTTGNLKNTIKVDLPWPRAVEMKTSNNFSNLVREIISSVL